jgi:acetyl-CoA synthetase
MHNSCKTEPAVQVHEQFIEQANSQHASLYELAQRDPQAYWHVQAQKISWFTPYHSVMEGSFAHPRWFLGGTLNLAYNCLDRHMPYAAHNVALYCADELYGTRTVTYAELLREVQKLANGLKSLGVKKGDRVAIYMPMIPEAVAAMLACARIGAIHTVVFAGFSAQALADRMQDASCSVIITADGSLRKGNMLALKSAVDVALELCPEVKHAVVVNHSSLACTMESGRDVWYHELLEDAAEVCAPEPMQAEDPAFILYTSGTTGKPKGIIHAVGGYAVGAVSSMDLVFDCKPDDVYWCTADIGWITGHTYVVYGPLMKGISQLMYEGALSHPHQAMSWYLIDQFKVSVFYTAPTAIRMFRQWGDDLPSGYNLHSLRLLGSVGEPLNPEAWHWYYRHIGRERCPIVDTWWQTETGSIMICSLPALHAMKPGCVGKPLPGINVELVDDLRSPVHEGTGYLTISAPWPSMMRGIWADEARFRATYFPHERYDRYVSGDAAYCDKDGDLMIIGRVDDVLNVSGHRIGTAEVESAIVAHDAVAEAAVVGKPDAIKGQAIVAFVSLKDGYCVCDELILGIKRKVVVYIGAFARPDEVIFCADLPKTRSGKIMRRLLKELVHGQAFSDTTTLANQDALLMVANQWQKTHRQLPL